MQCHYYCILVVGISNMGGLPRVQELEETSKFLEIMTPLIVNVGQDRASNIKLNGVCVARRNFENPADFIVCAIRSSPACAPSAGPSSFREAGTHTMDDTE